MSSASTATMPAWDDACKPHALFSAGRGRLCHVAHTAERQAGEASSGRRNVAKFSMRDRCDMHGLAVEVPR